LIGDLFALIWQDFAVCKYVMVVDQAVNEDLAGFIVGQLARIGYC
jgi:hypothetical protein